MNRYLDMKIGGNLYSTTIHVLVSAIKKLAPHTPKPDKLFRGLRDLNSLVQTCAVQNGFLERGFLSSSKSEKVARDYIRVNQVSQSAYSKSGKTSKERPALIIIFSKQPSDLLQICARIDFLSQSDEQEVEFLFLPWTLLEIKAGPKQDGRLTVIEVFAQSPLHVATIVEISQVGKKVCS
jgi:hypothetical protein